MNLLLILPNQLVELYRETQLEMLHEFPPHQDSTQFSREENPSDMFDAMRSLAYLNPQRKERSILSPIYLTNNQGPLWHCSFVHQNIYPLLCWLALTLFRKQPEVAFQVTLES